MRISKYLHILPVVIIIIAIRQLLSHTAGVYDVDNYDTMPAPCVSPSYAGRNYPLCVLATDPDHQFTPDELVSVAAGY